MILGIALLSFVWWVGTKTPTSKTQGYDLKIGSRVELPQSSEQPPPVMPTPPTPPPSEPCGDITFADFRLVCDESPPVNLTSVQRDEWNHGKAERVAELTGKKISWQGWVEDVERVQYAPALREYMEAERGRRVGGDADAYLMPAAAREANGRWLGHGDYVVRIDMDSPDQTWSIAELDFEVSKSMAMELQQNQRIWIRGRILSTFNGDNIRLEDGWSLFSEDPCSEP